MSHILETATYVDTIIFQNGMKDAQAGIPFDCFADKFWQAGHLAETDRMWASVKSPARGTVPSKSSTRFSPPAPFAK